jgi:hypothetical protein
MARPAFQTRYLTAHVERCDDVQAHNWALIRASGHLGIWASRRLGTGMRFPLGQEQTDSNCIAACRDSKDVVLAFCFHTPDTQSLACPAVPPRQEPPLHGELPEPAS